MLADIYVDQKRGPDAMMDLATAFRDAADRIENDVGEGIQAKIKRAG